MAYTFTRADVRTSVRNLLDMASPYPDDAVLNERLKSRWGELYALLVEVAPDLYVTEVSLTVHAPATGRAVSADDVYLVRSVIYVDTAGRAYPLREASLEEAQALEGVGSSRATHYRLLGTWNGGFGDAQDLVLYPWPLSGGGTYKMRYVTYPPAFDSDGATIDGFAYFQEWLAIAVAVDVKRAAQEDVTGYLARLEELERKIRGTLGRRSHEPAQILDDDMREAGVIGGDGW